ncbi:hypothetical protein [Paenibacillus dendritiformis]|uniref:hypothetical protein n=1 Tax=Paenibacillus dendritiformis TaxID=130049 RepID=UPI00387E15B2
MLLQPRCADRFRSAVAGAWPADSSLSRLQPRMLPSSGASFAERRLQRVPPVPIKS